MQFVDQGDHIGGLGVRPVGVEKIRVINGDLNVAAPHAFGARLLEEPGRRDFAALYHLAGDAGASGIRQTIKEEILEDAAGTAHAGRELLIANRADLLGARGESLRIAGRETQRGRADNPILALLEAGGAVVEAAFLIGELAESLSIKDADGHNPFVNLLSIGAGISVDGAADPAGDAFQRFEAGEGVRDREVDERLEIGAGFDVDHGVEGGDAGGAIAEDDAGEALVSDDEIRAAAEHERGETRSAYGRVGFEEGIRFKGVDEELSWSAESESSEAGEGLVPMDGESRKVGKRGEIQRVRLRLFFARLAGWA